MFVKRLGIDLGTANTLVFIPKRGIIINEPTVVAISINDNRILAVGQEAKEMLGRTPDTIIANRPMKDGVIADYRVTEAMLRYFINKAAGSVRIFRPEVMISVPGGITSTERRAVVDAARSAGAKEAYVIKETVAAAIGAGIDISTASGNMIIDLGGGTTDVSVISLGGIVTSTSVRVAGNKMDTALIDYIRKKHGLAVGYQTAEEVKIRIGSAIPVDKEDKIEVRGRDIVQGLPRTITVTTNEVVEAVQEQLREIIVAVRLVLQETPPELSSDIIDKGMVLTGGTALLRNIDKFLSQATGVPAYVADDPSLCVAKGTGIALENLDSYKLSMLAVK
ncbi:MAG: rod shape-determining protein [Candidatus Doudnabacteria bacterium CG10_big_fil_rev_8_21_14_0_10_41_10]|uniref:Cell shape-determining protein MreB n=1 Tax=Candidatus Doudnabacteria bacterium CG10_big_fil_rev_8_21_14_0_10_41_10 TaxID=1974551 RepID=A0A2H0VE33_9BACT|nr:MAG: rod shape-determining protein [Candidatus Doudnabacteria bacterium CG10_big_fil_rev_8_21_14_0_10_41_10]